MWRTGTYEMAEKKKKSHVFGSFKHSTNLETRPLSATGTRSTSLAIIIRRGGRHVLVELEVLVLDASLVDLDALNRDDTLLGREEPRVGGRVGEEEPAYATSRVSICATRRHA